MLRPVRSVTIARRGPYPRATEAFAEYGPMDEERPRPAAGITVGADLSRLSEHELADRIDALRAEIARVEAALAAKTASRAAADSVFRV